MLVFARTKIGADELAERLEARGFAAAALHGDMSQTQRERRIERLRERRRSRSSSPPTWPRAASTSSASATSSTTTCPIDAESYVHRIGRTGRAGRSGTRSCSSPRASAHCCKVIERFTGQRIAAHAYAHPRRTWPRDACSRSSGGCWSPRGRRARALPRAGRGARGGSRDRHGGDRRRRRAPRRRRQADHRRRHARSARGAAEPPTAPWCGCSSTRGARAGCGRATSSAPSRARSDIPGHEIGAIDIHAKFTFVELPTEYVDRVLERMKNAQIRQRPIVVKLAGGPPEAPKREPPPKAAKGNARERRRVRRLGEARPVRPAR